LDNDLHAEGISSANQSNREGGFNRVVKLDKRMLNQLKDSEEVEPVANTRKKGGGLMTATFNKQQK
jgi:hypothetical protein